MHVESCRTLLSNAWIGITSHNTYFICDPDYFNNFGDGEVLMWTTKIITGAAKLGYNIDNNQLIPALTD